MSYETKMFRLRTDSWLLLSADNTGDFEVQLRGVLPIMLFIGTTAPAASLRSDLIVTKKDFDGLGDAKVWGKAIGQDTVVTVMRQANAGNIEPVTLQPLQLSAVSFLTSLVEGAEIGTFTNKTSGSTVKLKRGTGSVALNGDGTKVLKGDKPTDKGKFKEAFVETHPLAVNDGFETKIEFIVGIPQGGVPLLALLFNGKPLTFSGKFITYTKAA